jgi:hypothetical protein
VTSCTSCAEVTELRASVWSAWSLLPLFRSVRQRLPHQKRRQAGRTPNASRHSIPFPCVEFFRHPLGLWCDRKTWCAMSGSHGHFHIAAAGLGDTAALRRKRGAAVAKPSRSNFKKASPQKLSGARSLENPAQSLCANAVEEFLPLRAAFRYAQVNFSTANDG